MSLTSWFKNAGMKKKAAVVTLAAINTLTGLNAAIVSHRVQLENPDVFSGSFLLNIAAGPMTTATSWKFSQKLPGTNSAAEGTPIPFVAAQTKKILPDNMDTALGIAVAVIGAPGAIAGHTTGVTISAARQYMAPPIR